MPSPVLCLAILLQALVPPPAGPPVPAREAASAAGREVARHLVRVRVEIVPQVRRPDGVTLRLRPVPEGVAGALVVGPAPDVLLSASALRADHAGIPLAPGAGFAQPPERRYTLLLADGQEVPLVVRRRIRPPNLLLLAPKDEKACPTGALPPPLAISPVRRPLVGEWLALPFFPLPASSPRTTVVVTRLTPAQAEFARPVLPAAGLQHLGMPVVSSDGTLVGLVNLPPPAQAAPRPRVDPLALALRRGPRDPREWAAGFRRPVLYSSEDLAGFFAALFADEGPRRAFAALGLEVAAQDGGLFVVAVEPGSPADRAGLLPGDELLFDGAAAGDADEALRRLEEAARRPDGRVTITVRRDDGPFEVTLRLGGDD